MGRIHRIHRPPEPPLHTSDGPGTPVASLTIDAARPARETVEHATDRTDRRVGYLCSRQDSCRSGRKEQRNVQFSAE